MTDRTNVRILGMWHAGLYVLHFLEDKCLLIINKGGARLRLRRLT